MTVKELMNVLANMPEDYKVFVFCDVDPDPTGMFNVAGGEAFLVERNDLTAEGFISIWGGN